MPKEYEVENLEVTFPGGTKVIANIDGASISCILKHDVITNLKRSNGATITLVEGVGAACIECAAREEFEADMASALGTLAKRE